MTTEVTDAETETACKACCCPFKEQLKEWSMGMSMGTYVCGSCAASGISNLGSHNNAKEAMLSFCNQELGGDAGFGTSHYQTLVAFYIFIAGPEVPVGAPGSSHHSKYWVRYGTEFAEFILEQGLGTIGTAGQKLNMKHHSSTTCQVWVWGPDQKALEKWYTKEKAAAKKKVNEAPVAPPAVAPEPKPELKSYRAKPVGAWDVAHGIAGGNYRCPHCGKAYVLDEKVWREQGFYYCESYGIEREGVVKVG